MNKVMMGALALGLLAGCSSEQMAGMKERVGQFNPMRRQAELDAQVQSTQPMQTVATGVIQNAPSVTTSVISPPAGTARTAAQYDTATPAQKAAALGGAGQTASKGAYLGTQTVSLGDPKEEGIWVKTSLVNSNRPGTIKLKDGANVLVDLKPLDGQGTAQISLSALRLLGLGITSLPVVEIYTR
ncbi:hypothetical protein [Donghicola mangrovi]|uniref:Lipoprotein n=1 Tax=Donghicola mangrovi TaxID=2729614 RepID=A0A850Q581_9RHOB|nr:hypothetical protein [Donghicola mangrovi]NVO24877.1 hypothetical protein [Donghicola mangrovi]